MIRLHLLGSVELKGSNGEELRSIIAQPKPMAMLAWLAAATPVGFHRREELLSIFWPELDSARGRRALSQALHVLRSDLDEGAIASRGVEELGLERTIVSTDVDDFRAAIERHDWKTALDLYRGELLSGFLISGSPEFDQWLDKERSRLRSQAIDAAWHLADEHSDASAARRAVELDPYSEHGIRRLLKFLDRTGNRAEAIRVYEEFRSRVARDLESEPSKETRALADSLRESPAARPVRRESKHARAPEPTPDVVASPLDETQSTTGRSSRLPWIIGAAVVLLVVGAVAMSTARNRSPDKTPALSRMVIAEFGSAPEDTALGRTITEAMRLDLSRSNIVKVMSDATVRDALVLMRRDTMLQITSDVAREVAVRESVPVVLDGDVRRAGSGFVLSASLVNASNGDLLNGWRASAKDSADIIRAIDNLSASVRQEAGESVRAIRTTSPLLRVSTTSLAALRKEAMGSDAFFSEDYPRAVQLLNEAVAEDSTFADAYLMLSTIQFNSWTHPSRSIEAAIKAYKYRDKLRDAEKYNVEFLYQGVVKGDIDAAIAAERNAAALDPGILFWGRYAGLLMQKKQFREAELAALQGLQWEQNPFLYYFLATARFRAGRPGEAQRTVAYGLQKFPASPLLLGMRVDMAESMGQYERADSLAHALKSDDPISRAALDAMLGKANEARQHLIDFRNADEFAGNFYRTINTWIYLALFELNASHDTTRALAIADSIVATKDWQSLYPNERQYAPLARFYVLAGKLDRARALLAEGDHNRSADYRAHDQWVERRARGMIRVAEGDASGADEVVSAAQTDPQTMSALADIVWSYRKLGRAQDAARAARAYLDERNPRRTDEDALSVGLMRALAPR